MNFDIIHVIHGRKLYRTEDILEMNVFGELVMNESIIASYLKCTVRN